jgi:hypothetical protein
VETLARASLPATDTVVANSLSQAQAVSAAVDAFRWDRLAPLRAAETQDDQRGRDAASTLTTLRDAVAADEFATRLGQVLSVTDDAIFAWLSAGQPAEPVPPPHHLGPDDIDIRIPKPLPAASGRATRAKGASSDDVLTQLETFLNEHRDERVVVEWRVQE